MFEVVVPKGTGTVKPPSPEKKTAKRQHPFGFYELFCGFDRQGPDVPAIAPPSAGPAEPSVTAAPLLYFQ